MYDCMLCVLDHLVVIGIGLLSAWLKKYGYCGTLKLKWGTSVWGKMRFYVQKIL